MPPLCHIFHWECQLHTLHKKGSRCRNKTKPQKRLHFRGVRMANQMHVTRNFNATSGTVVTRACKSQCQRELWEINSLVRLHSDSAATTKWSLVYSNTSSCVLLTLSVPLPKQETRQYLRRPPIIISLIMSLHHSAHGSSKDTCGEKVWSNNLPFSSIKH